MATLEEFVEQVTAEVEEEKPLYMANGDDKVEFTEADYEWLINTRASSLYWEQENGWKIARQDAYGDLSDQLDAIWHDIDNGKLDQTGEWYKAVKKVKDDIPKPE